LRGARHRAAAGPFRRLAPGRSALLRVGHLEVRASRRLAGAHRRARGAAPPARLAGGERPAADRGRGRVRGGHATRAAGRTATRDPEGAGMRVALVNPRWSFEGSIYFGCRDPHLPLEHGYAKALLEARGHQVLLLDAHLLDLGLDEVRAELRAFGPDMTVLTTAPTYLFWRCPPPELRVPRETAAAVREVAGALVAVGPHGSATPGPTLDKLGADVVVMGECEEVLARLADGEKADLPGVAFREGDAIRINGGPQATKFVDAAPLAWPHELVRRHLAHHHRFDREPIGPGAEVEASRGCPYHCSFCAKELFRDRYRRRDLAALLAEIDGLLAQGVEYLYFIDEIFLPNRALLEALCRREVAFGVQTRIDLWKPAMIELLGAAGCVSIEAGVESLTPEGRDALDKDCRIGT